MVSHSQKSLPLRDSTRHNDGRPIAVVSRIRGQEVAAEQLASESRPARAVFSATASPVSDCWNESNGAFRSAHKRAVWVQDVRAAVAVDVQGTSGSSLSQRIEPTDVEAAPGEAFARNRIQHALDLFGACMMIAAFLAFAMFA